MTRQGGGGGKEEVTVVGFVFGKGQRRGERWRWFGREVMADERVDMGMDNGGHGSRQRPEAPNIPSYFRFCF